MSNPASRDPWRNKRCLDCGYRLRGLSGDPRRCPECGLVNPSELPKEVRAATRSTIDRLRRPLRMAFFGALALGGGLGLLTRGFNAAGTSVGVAGLLGWVAGSWWFQRTSRRVPGSLSVFMLFQAASALLGLSIACFVLESDGRGGWYGPFFAAAGFVGMTLCTRAQSRLARFVCASLLRAVYSQGEGDYPSPVENDEPTNSSPPTLDLRHEE
jgi:hypothetical protein